LIALLGDQNEHVAPAQCLLT